MCKFVETVKLEDGRFFRLSYHQQRVDMTMQTFFPDVRPFDVAEVLKTVKYPVRGIYKCRVEYDRQVKLVEIVPYQRRVINRLQVVEMAVEPTAYKSTQRELFDKAFAKKASADDVLLTRQGMITDISYANIALWNGEKWFTPTQPALYGTQRAFLLEQGILEEKEIHINDLSQFQTIRIFNAMIEFGEIELDINQIVL